ncbi:hypothetical protein DLREEDagr8_02030 [Dongia sp. agr-C8]
MLLTGLAAIAAAGYRIDRATGDNALPSPEELKRRAEEWRRLALASFPYPRVECPGAEAEARWEELKRSGKGTPVVIGDEDSIVTMMQMLEPATEAWPGPRPAQEILSAAAGIRFPEDLRAYNEAQWHKAMAAIAEAKKKKPTIELTPDTVYREPVAPLGKWPAEAPEMPGLSVATDLRAPLPVVSIALIPTSDWTEIPAYLNWGAWNACPPPEFHVAAFRQWRDCYGVELVGMSFDTLNLRGARPPKSREEALALAQGQYLYCNDLVEQGAGDLSALAAALMASDWWYFWWD